MSRLLTHAKGYAYIVHTCLRTKAMHSLSTVVRMDRFYMWKVLVYTQSMHRYPMNRTYKHIQEVAHFIRPSHPNVLPYQLSYIPTPSRDEGGYKASLDSGKLQKCNCRWISTTFRSTTMSSSIHPRLISNIDADVGSVPGVWNLGKKFRKYIFEADRGGRSARMWSVVPERRLLCDRKMWSVAPGARSEPSLAQP